MESIIKVCEFLTRLGKWTVLFCIRFGKWTNYQTLLYFVHNLHRFGIVLVGLVFGPTVFMYDVEKRELKISCFLYNTVGQKI